MSAKEFLLKILRSANLPLIVICYWANPKKSTQWLETSEAFRVAWQ